MHMLFTYMHSWEIAEQCFVGEKKKKEKVLLVCVVFLREDHTLGGKNEKINKKISQ